MNPYPSTFWTDQHDTAGDIFADYNIPLLDRNIHQTDTLHRSSSQPTFTPDESGLLHPQPGLVHRAAFITGEEGCRRYSSPSRSSNSLRSSTVSTTLSERHDTPRFSPEAVDLIYTRSSSSFTDDFALASGGFDHLSRQGSFPNIDCIAMDEVQKFADESMEEPSFSFDGNHSSWTGHQYPYAPEEGFVPLDQSGSTPATWHSTPTSDETYGTKVPSRDVSEEQQRPKIRHRRTTSSTSTLTVSKGQPSRVSKRPVNKRATSYRSVKSEPEEEDDFDPQGTPANKTFPCLLAIYGCQSTFGNKNEWKRHIQTQHMLLEHWHCVQCEDAQESRRPNDFNRRDLFIQHVIRMHPHSATTSPNTSKKSKKPPGKSPRSEAEQHYLDNAATTCHRQLRQPPETSRCVVCNQHWHGPGTWEQRLEHIGRHFEDAKRTDSRTATDPQNWHIDQDVERYLLREGIIVQRGDHLVLAEERRQSGQ